MYWKCFVMCVAVGFLSLMVTDLCAEAPEFTPEITDITVFKDGHALVMSKAETEFEDGWCRTREVPVPVLGTFWTFTTKKNAEVVYVRADMTEIEEERPCMNFVEMIQANTGRQVIITEQFGELDPITHDGIIAGILEHESEGEVPVSRTVSGGRDAYGHYRNQRTINEANIQETVLTASFVMLKCDDGMHLIRLGNIRGINIKGNHPATMHKDKKEKREISMRVVEKDRPLKKKAEIGMVYLQKGVRWIPSYNIELLDNKKARISLRAVIINDIIDLEEVNLHLVVGVPSFVMKENLSPMSLRETGLSLSSFFRPPSEGGSGSQYNYFYNAMTSQRAMSYEEGRGVESGGPNIPGEGQNEDLFLYDVKDFSLKKGARAVINLVEVVVPYEDIYTWDVPAIPPREMWRNINNDQQRQLAKALAGAKAMHEIRLQNTGDVPWTTGPAMIFKDGALLGQQLMTYTSVNNSVDVPVTIATDLNTKKEEREVQRTPNVVINNDKYTKVALHGTLTIKNFKDRDVRVIVRRTAMGVVTSATDDSKIVKANAAEDTSLFDDGYPWYRWSWPWWWYSVNSISKVTWEKTIKAGESATFEYDWYYHYRH